MMLLIGLYVAPTRYGTQISKRLAMNVYAVVSKPPLDDRLPEASRLRMRPTEYLLSLVTRRTNQDV
jgi:hypothetical protein